MKTVCCYRKTGIIALLCVVLMFSITSGDVFADETIRITAGEWAPYLSPELPDSGIAGRIITEVFQLHGIKTEFDFYPWKRAYELARRGKSDATALWFKNSEREKIFYYSAPVVTEKFVFFHLKSKPFSWETITDLQGKIIGGLIGFSYGEDIDQAVEAGLLKIDRTSSDIQNFKKLLSGRIEVYPQEINVGYQVLNSKFLAGERAQITHHDKPFLSQHTYLLLSRKHKRNEKLRELFNAGLETLNEQGKIEAYYDHIRQMQ